MSVRVCVRAFQSPQSRSSIYLTRSRLTTIHDPHDLLYFYIIAVLYRARVKLTLTKSHIDNRAAMPVATLRSVTLDSQVLVETLQQLVRSQQTLQQAIERNTEQLNLLAERLPVRPHNDRGGVDDTTHATSDNAGEAEGVCRMGARTAAERISRQSNPPVSICMFESVLVL